MTSQKSIDQSFVWMFWARVRKSVECWTWTGPRRQKGPGLFNYVEKKRYKQGRAHVFSFLLHGGRIHAREYVTQMCGNPICVNPEHLTTVAYKKWQAGYYK